MDHSGSSSEGAKELRKQQDALRAEIKKLLAWDPDFLHLFDQFAGLEALLDAKRAELAEVGAKLRGLQDIPTQRASQEAHCKKIAKHLEAAQSEHTALQEKLEEVQTSLATQQTVVDRLLREQAEAKVKMEELTLASVGLPAQLQQASAIGASQASAVAAAVPAGCVSIAFAEEQWAVREAAYAAQLAQLQALVAPVCDSAAPSEAGDAEAGEALNLEDDEVWNKVAPSKRHSFVRREKEILARKLRTGLGRVGSVSSPFKK